MSAVEDVINELSGIYNVRIDPALFYGSRIYTTNQFLSGFSKRWGFITAATGIVLDRKDWNSLKSLLGIADYVGAQEFLPNICLKKKNGFTIVSGNEVIDEWNYDHELIHLAHYKHSIGFRRTINKFSREKTHSISSVINRIETEIIYEICAYQSNVPEMTWEYIRENIIGEYLVDCIRKYLPRPDAISPKISYFIDNVDELIDKISKSKEPSKTLSHRFFSLEYKEPFKEAKSIF